MFLEAAKKDAKEHQLTEQTGNVDENKRHVENEGDPRVS
jgi:hypothetical protein